MRTLISEDDVQAAVSRLAHEIEGTYRGESLTIVGVLTGSIVLLADLIRQLSMPLRVGVVQASSYRGEMNRGALMVQTELLLDITDHHVLVVDDIFDTGHTLQELCATLRQHRPRSLRTSVLLRKTGREEVTCRPDFVGFEIPNVFVVGYGLDYRDAYRNLPYIAVIDQPIRDAEGQVVT